MGSISRGSAIGWSTRRTAPRHSGISFATSSGRIDDERGGAEGVNAVFSGSAGALSGSGGLLMLIGLFAAGVAGGALNSVAGGGSFIVFPTLILGGVPPVAANATTTVALWPAGLASASAYRHHLLMSRR